MSAKKIVFIISGLIICLFICFGFYVNDRINTIATNNGFFIGDIFQSANTPGDKTGQTGSPDKSGVNAQNIGPNNSSDSSTTTVKPDSNSNNTSQTQQIASAVQSKINKPIDKADMVKAGLIILRRLNASDISFLYNLGQKSKKTPDEINQARTILKDKLSEEEIHTLQALGNKYGQNLDFLSKS